jgi:hypothetical protein
MANTCNSRWITDGAVFASIPGRAAIREANVNVAEFIGKRVLRLGWLILLLIVAQSFVSSATRQSGLSRTAPLPPADTVAIRDERQSLH